MAPVAKGWRPFWMHQTAEYIVGLVLVASGLQAPEPLWPALMGGLVIINTALSGPPLGAFHLVGRRQHRRLDLIVLAVVAVVAILPFLTIDTSSRITMIVIVVVLGVVWWGTSFEHRQRTVGVPSGKVDADSIGRTAGRLWVKAGDAIRKRQGE
jgi:hypothetical protein